MTTRKRPATEIDRLDQIPDFASEAEEAAFWCHHEISVALWRSLPPPPAHVQSILDSIPHRRERRGPDLPRADGHTSHQERAKGGPRTGD